MTQEEMAEKVREALDSTKSAHKRLDRLEKRQDNLETLTRSVDKMQTEQEYIKGDIGEIKADVKSLTEKPAKRWESVIDKAIVAVVGALIGAILNGGGII